MPGPPPNPNAVRRNTRVGLVQLPAGGYDGRIPKWPLPVNPKYVAKIQLLEDGIEELENRSLDEDLTRTERTKLTRLYERLAIATAERDAIVEGEKDLWRKLWRTPQAAQWARLKWDREVAQYVRHKAAAEVGSLDDSKEARLRADALGLSPKGMRSLLWTIPEDELAARRGNLTPVPATGTDGSRRRARPAAVDPGKS